MHPASAVDPKETSWITSRADSLIAPDKISLPARQVPLRQEWFVTSANGWRIWGSADTQKFFAENEIDLAAHLFLSCLY